MQDVFICNYEDFYFNEDAYWELKGKFNNFDIRIFLYENLSSPSPEDIVSLKFIAANFLKYLNCSYELIKNKGLSPEDFFPTAIWHITRIKGSLFFTLYFNQKSNEFNLWRVEFLDGKPLNLGCDS